MWGRKYEHIRACTYVCMYVYICVYDICVYTHLLFIWLTGALLEESVGRKAQGSQGFGKECLDFFYHPTSQWRVQRC